MHRAKSNTSLDERALTEAAKEIHPGWVGMSKLQQENLLDDLREDVGAYLAALPELPLDEWLKTAHVRFTDDEGTEIVLYDGRISLTGKPSMKADDGSVAMGFDVTALLEALAEHRKEGQHG